MPEICVWLGPPWLNLGFFSFDSKSGAILPFIEFVMMKGVKCKASTRADQFIFTKTGGRNEDLAI